MDSRSSTRHSECANLSRREFIRIAGLGAACFAGWGEPQRASAAAATNEIKRPNVLFIAVDDLNDWTSLHKGHRQAITPNLERLAKRGVTFTSAHCAAPACNPSRAALMTGHAPYNSGMYKNEQVWREVLGEALTIPQYLTKHGYYSAGAGKIFHNNQPDPASWQDYYPSKTRHMPKYHYPDKRPANMPYEKDMYVEFDWWGHDFPDEETGDFGSVQYISEQLKKKHDRPFFLACGLYRPHLPWFVPKKYFDMFPLDSIELPKVKADDWDDLPKRARQLAGASKRVYHDRVIKHNQWKQAVRAYLASIAYADAMVGRLLDALDGSAFRDNTIIVLWSDHGWQLGEKFHWRKFVLWQNVTRCNLMFAVPKGAPALPEGAMKGGFCKRVVSLMDIYPTLIDLCGLPKRSDIDGHSLVGLLKRPDSPWDRPAVTSLHVENEFSVTTERWRYIRYRDGGEELYDLDSDAEEWYNLADNPEYAKVKKKMAAHSPQDPAPIAQTSYAEKFGKRNKQKKSAKTTGR